MYKLAALLFTYFTFTPSVAFAACQSCAEGELCNPIRFCSLFDFLQGILQAIITIAFPIIVLFIVFIGFKFIVAQGDPEELKKTRTYFFWAIVGALIILGAQALSFAIKATVDGLGAGVL